MNDETGSDFVLSNEPLPTGYEILGIVNQQGGATENLVGVVYADEWRELYPDALDEAREQAEAEFHAMFGDKEMVLESEFRRRLAGQSPPTPTTDADSESKETRTRQRRRRQRDDHLTLTVEEAGEQLGISRALAYEAVRRGEIPALRIGRRILIPKAALNRLLESAQLSPESDGE